MIWATCHLEGLVKETIVFFSARPLVLQDPAAGAHLAAAPPPLPGALPRRFHQPHALRRQRAPRAPRGQLPRRQRRPTGVRASRGRLGGLWGHVVGPRLPDAAVARRLHQGVCLQRLDTQDDGAPRQEVKTAKCKPSRWFCRDDADCDLSVTPTLWQRTQWHVYILRDPSLLFAISTYFNYLNVLFATGWAFSHLVAIMFFCSLRDCLNYMIISVVRD